MKFSTVNSCINCVQLWLFSLTAVSWGTALILFFRLIAFNDGSLSFAESFSSLTPWLALGFAVCSTATVLLFRAVQKNYRSLAVSDAELTAKHHELQKSETHFRELFENANDPIYTIDLQGNFTSLNKAGKKFIDCPKVELSRLNIADVVAPEHLELARQMVTLKLTENIPVVYEIQLATKNKKPVIVELSTRAIFRNGEPVAMQGIVHDISARKKVELELQKNLSLLSSTFEATADAILVVDRNNQIVTYNQRFIDVWQFPDDIIITKDNSKYIDFALSQMVNPEVFVKKNAEIALHPEIQSYDNVELKDGRIYERYSHPQILDGTVIGRVVSFRDITERKRAENTLRQSQANLAAAQRITHLGSWEVDLTDLRRLNNSKTSWSDEVYRIFGYEPGQVAVSIKHFFDSIHPTDRSSVRRAFLEAVSYRRNLKIEYRIVLPHGSVRIHQGQAEVICDEKSGKPLKFIGTVQDITERRQTEDKVRESKEWLQAVFDASRDGILIEDGANIAYINKFYAQLLGYKKPEDLIGKPVAAITSPAEAQRLEEYGRMRLSGENAPSLYEFTNLRQDKTPVSVEGAVSTAIIGGKKYIMTAVRDIAERKRAEEAVRQSEEKYRTILETIEEGYYEVDLAGNYTFFNDAVAATLKCDKEHLKGLNFRRFVDAETAKKLARIYRKVLITRQPVANLECEIVRRDGTRMFAESSVTLICDRNDKAIGFRGVVRDVTERHRVEGALRESEAHYRLLFERNPHPIWVYDLETLQIVAVNQAAVRHYGYSRDEFLKLNLRDMRLPEDIPHLLNFLPNKTVSDEEVSHAARHRKKDGTIIEIEVTAQSITFAGRICRLGLITDVTQRNRANAALLESEYKFRTLLESMHEGLVRVSNDEVIEFVNDRFCEMTGFAREELLGKITFEMLFDENGRKTLMEANRQRLQGISGEYELSLKKKSGETFWALVGGAPIANAEHIVTGSMGVFTDITERKRAEEQLLHDAFHDNLTGLANRALFMDHLRMTIERGKSRHSNPYAVLFLDFDRFKVINDSLGHAEGDLLLKLIARRLELATRTGDLVGRLGGDEFVILLSEMLSEDDAVQVAGRIQESLENPFDLSGSDVYISASIGIALSTAGHLRAEDMVRDADIAMYSAKAAGRARYQVFDQAMHQQATSHLQMETEMRQALERGDFVLYYQPIINLKTNLLDGFEALIRWIHPQRGVISPVEFIPAAEENNLILPLGRWILQESCRQLREWQKKHPAADNLQVSVNLSGKQFLQADLAEQVVLSLIAADLAPRCLKLEITESYLMENSEKTVEIMERLRDIGVEISLDDFGTGYSSLSYLHRLPVDYLKIDRSFVSRMTDSKENSEIVYTIIKLAQNLKMRVIAEGIETLEQLEHLKNLNCEYGQGFYFSKPVEPTAAEKFIEENTKDALFIASQKDFGVEHFTPV